jgi:hypothetical protein
VFANRFASFALAIEARGRLAEGRSMDRDLETPKKSEASTTTCAEVVHVPAGLPMKQIRRCLNSHTTRTADSSEAHDKDGMFNKEFHR